MEKDDDPEWPGPSRKRREENVDSKSVVPSKRSRKGYGCIIHHDSIKDDDNLTAPKDYDSWSTLLKAARIRQYTAVLDIAASLTEGEMPDIRYHRDCRSLFTMKKDLLSLSKQPTEKIRESPSKFRSSRRESLEGPSRVYDAVCVFCQRKTKYKRKSRTKEELTKCKELRGDESVRTAAIRKNDQRVLALSSRELVAAEAHYHFSCYRDYTRCIYEGNPVSANTDVAAVDDDMTYNDREREAYEILFEMLQIDVFVSPRVVTMSSLQEKNIGTMNSLGESDIKPSTKKHLRRKIETEFGNAINVFPDDRGKLLAIPDNLTVCDLARRNQELVKELDERKRKDVTDKFELVKQTAQALRLDIKEKEAVQNWPPSLEDLESFEISSQLTKQFLTTLLTGETKLPVVDISDRNRRLVNSFAQDLIYAISVGTIKTPKHILLPFAVKSLTGNSELIRILNRLGHAVSYSQVEEIDTALCLNKLARAETEGAALPSNIIPHVHTTLAWDNIDRLEETLTGEETSHRVNGIAVQAKVFGPEPQKLEVPIQKNKRRTIDPVVEELPVYNSGERSGPPLMATAEDVDYFGITRQAWLKNLVWILTRLIDFKNQTVSGWTGFNIMCRSAGLVLQDAIGYLPTVNFPATDMSTVFEVLNRSLIIMRSLKLNSIVCVFDQAAEIVWKHRDRFSGIILRMGTFHTICTLLGVIGKRFQDAELKDICVEAGVVASGSIAGVMEGRKYNRAIRVHKLCYEAFMRLIWKEFLIWIESDREDAKDDIDKAMSCIRNLQEEITEETFCSVQNDDSCKKVAELFSEYQQHLRNGNDSLSTFWVSYIDLVEILLNLIRVSREGDWHLHLASIRGLIPWCFAYDRLNYSRYLPVYYAKMKNLETENPDIHNYLNSGGFAVQLGAHNPFGKIPVDQTIEETVNKDTQTAGGTKGFSLKAGTVSRYYITAEYRSAFLGHLRQVLNLDDSGISHGDLMKPRIHKDEADVVAVMDLLETSWVNPFSPDKLEIVSLSTAVAAPDNIEQDLLNAQTVGEREYTRFKSQRLEVIPPLVKFHDRMPKQN